MWFDLVNFDYSGIILLALQFFQDTLEIMGEQEGPDGLMECPPQVKIIRFSQEWLIAN